MIPCYFAVTQRIVYSDPLLLRGYTKDSLHDPLLLRGSSFTDSRMRRFFICISLATNFPSFFVGNLVPAAGGNLS